MNQLFMSTVGSPVGTLRILCNHTHIIRLLFEQDKTEALNAWLKKYLGYTEIGGGNGISERCCEELEEYFGSGRREFSVPRKYFGTEFQIKIWEALESLPYGSLISYTGLGSKANVKGARAIGSAVGDNPIPVICPCHRVIRSDGGLGGYSGGLDKKLKLLALEGVTVTGSNRVLVNPLE